MGTNPAVTRPVRVGKKSPRGDDISHRSPLTSRKPHRNQSRRAGWGKKVTARLALTITRRCTQRIQLMTQIGTVVQINNNVARWQKLFRSP